VHYKDVGRISGIKRQYGVPNELRSCHTAIVDGYVLEGHVPADAIIKLLHLRPADVIGLGVPGMPIGSPGMEVEHLEPEKYHIYAFDKEGNALIFSTYNDQ